MTPHRRSRLVGSLICVGALSLSACGDSDEGSDQPSRKAAYVVMLDWLLANSGVAFGERCEDPVVFVEAMGSNDIALDDQVGLVNDYEDSFELRFIDSRDEAIDDTAAELTVRDDCVLIGFGPMATGSSVEVRAETYRHSAAVSAFKFELSSVTGSWLIASEPERVDAEGLVVEE
jgi:hypothetical protein